MLEKNTNFWKTKSLNSMTPDEWESLCDGCAICCLNKIEDEDTGEYFYTSVACSMLDIKSCRCKDFKNRSTIVPDCLELTPETVRKTTWLPATCAYRLIAESQELEWWHPLVSGDPGTVRDAGISLHGKIVSEEQVDSDSLAEHVVDWVVI